MKKRVRFFSILVSAMMLMSCFVQPALAVSEDIVSRIQILSLGTQSVVYTALRHGSTSTEGDGSQNNPYNRFEDALANVADGGTIYIDSPFGFINADDNSPMVINKNVTINGQGNSLSVRKAGIVLGADVKFENVTLSFAHKYHDAIFANGNTLTLENVTCYTGGRNVDIFGGGLYDLVDGTAAATSGNDAQIIITGSSSGFGNIYAGSMNGVYNGNTTITMKDVKAMDGGIVYASGALETYVNLDDLFDLEEPAPPVAKPDTYTVSGTVTVKLDSCDTSQIYGGGSGSTNIEYSNSYRNNNLQLNNINKLTVKNGSVLSPNALTGSPAVVLEGSSTIDFSQMDAADNNLTIASLTSSGDNNKLILSEEGLLNITGELSGNAIIFEAENGYNGHSGMATYDHTYVTTGGGTGSFTFSPFAAQADMTFTNDGNSWKTSAQSEDYYEPLYLDSFNVENKSFIISKDIINGWNASVGGGVTSAIEPFKVSFTWPDEYVVEDSYLEFVPINYQVEYNGQTYKATLKEDYSAYIAELGMEFVGMSSSSDSSGTTGVIYINIYFPEDGSETTPIDAGNYEITIMPASADGHFSETVTLTVVEGNGKQQDGVTINATVTTAKILKDSTEVTSANFNDKINFEVIAKEGQTNARNAEVKLYINGNEYNQTQTTSQGTATFTDVEVSTDNGFKSGENEITVMYMGTKDADGSNTVAGASMETLQLTVNEVSNAKLDTSALGQQSNVYSGLAVGYELSQIDVVDDKNTKLNTVSNPTIKYQQNGKEVTPVLPGIYDVVISVPAGANHSALETTITGGLNILTAEPQVSLSYSLGTDGTVTLEAKFTGVSDTAVPLGTVQFYKDDTICGSGTLSFGEANVKISGLTEGEHIFYAVYSPVYTGTSPYSRKNSANVKVNIQQQSVAVTGVTVDTTNTVNVGNTVKLTPTISPLGATNKEVSWVSLQPEIASVAEDGTVSGLKAGKAYIVVTTADGGYSATCEVTVNENTSLTQTTSISLNETSVDIDLSTLTKTATITAATTPADGNVLWSTSDSLVATVKDGVITGVGNGTATITARAVYGSASATCTVNVTGGVVQPSSVLISPRTAILQIGGTTEVDLKATVSPGTASQSVTWESSNTAVATVKDGKVTAVSAGTTIISAKTSNGIIDAITVTVQPKAVVSVQGITLSNSSLSMTTGGTSTLTATLNPTNADNQTVTWTSSSDAVTVNGNGLTATLSAKKAGSATITVTTQDGSKSASCTVSVKDPVVGVTGVILNKASMSMYTGDTAALTATVTPTNATNKSVSWSSSNTSVATVDANGNVKAVGAGSSVITVKTANGGHTARCTVTVSNRTVGVQKVSLPSGSLTLTAGSTTSMTATISPSNATNKAVTWTSSATNVVSVSGSGLTATLTAKNSGTAVITVTTKDGNYKAQRTVYVQPKGISVLLSKSSGDIGEKITVSGYGAKQYKFVWSYNNWEKWGIIKPMNTTSTASFTHTIPGTYTIYMDAMDSTGKITTKTVSYTANRNYDVTLNVNAANPVQGGSITASANATGNTSGLKYKFVWSYNNWSKWGVISSPSATKNVSFKPMAGEGNYDIYLDVIDGYGNVMIKSVRKYVGLSAVSTISVSKTNAVVGDSITLTANSTGIGARYKLVWCYNNNWQEWSVLKPMNSTKTVVFIPKKAGRNTIYMDVIDSYGNTYTKSLDINVSLGWSLNSVTASATTAKVGNALTVTANSSGTKASGLKYKFVWSCNNWSNWGIIQNGTGKTAKFTPSKAGEYEFYVDAFDSYGNVVTKKVAVTVNP